MELINNIQKITTQPDCEMYTAHNGKLCYRTFGGLDYYFLMCGKFGIAPKIIYSGLSYEAGNEEIELDYCEHDIILHIKKIFVKSPFSGWHEVSKEQAKKWATHKIEGANCKREKVVEIVKSQILGATLEGLGVDICQ